MQIYFDPKPGSSKEENPSNSKPSHSSLKNELHPMLVRQFLVLQNKAQAVKYGPMKNLHFEAVFLHNGISIAWNLVVLFCRLPCHHRTAYERWHLRSLYENADCTLECEFVTWSKRSQNAVFQNFLRNCTYYTIILIWCKSNRLKLHCGTLRKMSQVCMWLEHRVLVGSFSVVIWLSCTLRMSISINRHGMSQHISFMTP